MFDTNECREHAKRCVTMAAQTTNPVLKQRFSEMAQAWARLASQLAETDEPPTNRRDRDKQVA